MYVGVWFQSVRVQWGEAVGLHLNLKHKIERVHCVWLCNLKTCPQGHTPKPRPKQKEGSSIQIPETIQEHSHSNYDHFKPLEPPLVAGPPSQVFIYWNQVSKSSETTGFGIFPCYHILNVTLPGTISNTVEASKGQILMA